MKKTGFRSIRTQMLLWISALGIVICIVFFFVAMQFSQSAVSTLAADSLSSISRQGADLILQRVSSHYDKLSAVAMNDLFISNYMSESRLFAQLTKVKQSEGYQDLLFVKPSGEAYSSKGKIEYDLKSPEYVRGMKGERYVSSPIATGEGDEMIMNYVVPVMVADEPRGVLIGVRDAYEISDIIADITFGQSGYAYVIDAEGTVIGHPNRELVTIKDNTVADAQNNPALLQLASIERRMAAGEQGVDRYSYNGVEKFAGFAPIADTGWSMALTAPRDEVYAQVDRMQWVLLIATAVLALANAGAGFLIARSVSIPLKKGAVIAQEYASGDFSNPVPEAFLSQRNEIGQLAVAFDALFHGMNELLSNIKTASGEVLSGSNQISDSGQLLAQGTTEQASTLEQLSASVEEIAAQTRMSTTNAGEANSLAAKARGMAERGNEKMNDLLSAMETIDRSSSDIEKIIKVIDDIAFQTNILALNAAVEAARAGEHGKGFAVVAEEVRNLAAKSASAAKETADLIKSSADSVDSGSRMARETADMLSQIVAEIARVATLVSGISNAASEQSTGIDQINMGLTQVSQVVQSNSATAQQSAAASQQLTAQADVLNRQVGRFKLMQGARADASPEVMKPTPAQTPAAPAREAEPIAPPRAAAKIVPMASAKPAVPAAAKPRDKGLETPVRRAPTRPLPIALDASGDGPIAPPPLPDRISLGEDEFDEPPAPAAGKASGKVALSDREFGKY
ncbi:MAG: methyl-accepting chemotaxis protein [Christensenellaceae bacterium]|nr:methyl-accepting chemotaxis protein [Christensenellaceae bacterium]